MRRFRVFLLAAAIGIAGAAESLQPAQAAFMPLMPQQVTTSDNIVQVHRRRYRTYRRPVIIQRYYQPYPYYYYPHAYYRSYPYPYYYRRPGLSFQFSFGGGHRYYGW